MNHGGFRVFGSVLKWTGLAGVVTGAAGSAFAVWSFVQTQTGWGLSEVQRCCIRGEEVNRAALALLLGCMFFVLAGSGLVLISRPLLRAVASGWWPRWMARGLFVYSACCFALAVILLNELAARPPVIVGLVVYCVMVALGLLIAAWGLRRFSDAG